MVYGARFPMNRAQVSIEFSLAFVIVILSSGIPETKPVQKKKSVMKSVNFVMV